MGVVNVTPDSFSDGGRFLAPEAAIAHARFLVGQGAGILDIGGESTRPGSAGVSAAGQCERVLPVFEALRGCGAALSVDTSEPEVMVAALDCGAHIVNDVRAFSRPGALAAVAGRDCGLIAMHMQGEPQTMQDDPDYADVVAEVCAWLEARCQQIEAAGIAADRIAIDPGFGFGKTHAHNLRLLAHLGRFAATGRPVAVGLSRKSTLGAVSGRALADRDTVSAAASLLAVQSGARVVRVHDVGATRDALSILQSVCEMAGGDAPAGR